MNQAMDNILNRRSVRAYENKPVEKELLEQVALAGSYAPTSMGRQSPRMVVVQDQETIALMSRLNAQVMGQTEGDPFYGAPAVIIVFIDKDNPKSVLDGSLVMGNLMNAAHALGLGSCWIHRAKETFESPEGQKLLKKWGLEDRYQGLANCILGYPAEQPTPKPRKEEYIIWDK